MDLLNNIQKLKKMQEARQQYQTPAKEQNNVPSNSEGSIGDTVLVNLEGSKFLYIKGMNEWHKTGLANSTDTTVIATSNTGTGTTTGSTPSVSISVALSGNTNVVITFSVSNENSFNIKRREGSEWSAGTNETTIATSGSSPITDTSTSPSIQYVYRITAQNSFGTNSADSSPITTNALGTAFNITYLESQDPNQRGYADGELIEAAEYTDVGGTYDSTSVITKYLNNSDFTNDDILYNNSNATTPFNGTTFEEGSATDNFFAMDGTIDKVFEVSSTGVLSNVIESAPLAPTVTLSVISSTQINVTVEGDMRVARNIEIQRKTGSGSFSTIATISPTSNGSLADDDVITTYPNNTGLTAGITYVYRARGKNNVHNGTWSSEVSETTAAAGTAWSDVPVNFTLEAFGYNGVVYSPSKTITLTNGSGNTTIQCSQSGLNGALLVAASTSSTPSTSDTYTTSVTIANAGTYYLRFKYARLKSIDDNNAQTITFTNNSVSNIDLDITCIGSDLAQP